MQKRDEVSHEDKVGDFQLAPGSSLDNFLGLLQPVEVNVAKGNTDVLRSLVRIEPERNVGFLVTPPDPTFTLQFPGFINSLGEIAGFGVTSTGDTHAFLATLAPTTAAAGPKNTTVIARQITLDGTASFSADGKPLTYLWSIPQGSPSAAILHGTTASPEVQFASGRNAYIFPLTVTDSTGTSATDLVTVNFQGN